MSVDVIVPTHLHAKLVAITLDEAIARAFVQHKHVIALLACKKCRSKNISSQKHLCSSNTNVL